MAKISVKMTIGTDGKMTVVTHPVEGSHKACTAVHKGLVALAEKQGGEIKETDLKRNRGWDDDDQYVGVSSNAPSLTGGGTAD